MLKVELPKDYKTEDLEMLMSVAQQLGIDVTSAVYPLANQFKVTKGIITCTLCGTITFQWMKISKYSNGVWMKEKDLEEGELIGLEDKVSKAQIITAKVSKCWSCERVFMLKSKEELVRIILDSHTPITSRQEIWKHITSLRSAAVSEAVQRKKREERGDRDEE